MRACATANALVLGLGFIAAAFAACSNGSTPPPDIPPGANVNQTTTTAPLIDPPPSKSAPKTAADCKNLASEITNDPPSSGVALNNAQTSGDAGSTDRLAPLTELVKSRRDGFRCCFDIWAREHPGAHGTMKM